MNARVLAVVLLIGLASSARADRIDELGRVLTTDPNWRVRLQAAVVLGKLHDARGAPSLVRALSDASETVRGTAASVLGELGEPTAIAALERSAAKDPSTFVRDQAQTALESLRSAHAPEPPAVAPNGSKTARVELGSVGSKTMHLGPEQEKRLRAIVSHALSDTPGVTLVEPGGADGYRLDVAVTRLQRREVGENIQISCEVSLILGRLPSKEIVMTTTGSASVDAPSAGLAPERARELLGDALEGAVRGAHANVVTFLQSKNGR